MKKVAKKLPVFHTTANVNTKYVSPDKERDFVSYSRTSAMSKAPNLYTHLGTNLVLVYSSLTSRAFLKSINSMIKPFKR